MHAGDSKGGVYVSVREDVEPIALPRPGLLSKAADRLRRIARFVYQLLTEN